MKKHILIFLSTIFLSLWLSGCNTPAADPSPDVTSPTTAPTASASTQPLTLPTLKAADDETAVFHEDAEQHTGSVRLRCASVDGLFYYRNGDLYAIGIPDSSDPLVCADLADATPDASDIRDFWASDGYVLCAQNSGAFSLLRLSDNRAYPLELPDDITASGVLDFRGNWILGHDTTDAGHGAYLYDLNTGELAWFLPSGETLVSGDMLNNVVYGVINNGKAYTAIAYDIASGQITELHDAVSFDDSTAVSMTFRERRIFLTICAPLHGSQITPILKYWDVDDDTHTWKTVTETLTTGYDILAWEGDAAYVTPTPSARPDGLLPLSRYDDDTGEIAFLAYLPGSVTSNYCKPYGKEYIVFAEGEYLLRLPLPTE